jgi:GNAT superfamily N-acetyltransferase
LIVGYQISSQNKDMDLSIIHGYLSQSYWAKNIPIKTMKTAIDNSLCFGVFTDSGSQVAFARMITDTATFAYLSDVFVLEEHRGKGISKWLMQEILTHPQLQGIRRMALATSDAHGLYQQFGFKALGSPASFMELHQPDVYL